MRLPDTYFFPDDLSRALWSLRADAVFLYRRDESVLRCTAE